MQIFFPISLSDGEGLREGVIPVCWAYLPSFPNSADFILPLPVDAGEINQPPPEFLSSRLFAKKFCPPRRRGKRIDPSPQPLSVLDYSGCREIPHFPTPYGLCSLTLTRRPTENPPPWGEGDVLFCHPEFISYSLALNGSAGKGSRFALRPLLVRASGAYQKTSITLSW